MYELTRLDDVSLTTVVGGASSTHGRCGPGSGMKFLGNVSTPQCARHDNMVDQFVARGSSLPAAHAKSLIGLPSAIGSYMAERYNQVSDKIVDALDQ